MISPSLSRAPARAVLLPPDKGSECQRSEDKKPDHDLFPGASASLRSSPVSRFHLGHTLIRARADLRREVVYSLQRCTLAFFVCELSLRCDGQVNRIAP